MRKYTYITLIFILTSIANIVFAQQSLFEKEFEFNENRPLIVNNRFGNISIQNWDEPTIRIQVELIMEGFSDKERKAFLDKIKIVSSVTNNQLKVETDNNLESLNMKGKQKFEINYAINLPENQQLEIKNQFGNILLPDRSSNTTIALEYGDLLANKIQSAELSVSFGDCYIESMQSGRLIFKYVDDAEIEFLNDVKLESSFSEVSVTKANVLDINFKWGEFAIENVNTIVGSTSYAEFEIASLYKRIRLNASHTGGDLSIARIANTVEEVELDLKYGKAELIFESGRSYSFSSKHSFGKLHYDADDFNFSKQNESNLKRSYEGTFGNGATEGIIRLASNYAEIEIEME